MRWIFVVFALIGVQAHAEVEIHELTSKAGIDFWFVEAPEIPFVAVELHFAGGGRLDARDKRGSVNLMSAMLNEGAGERDARAFQIALDDLATSFRARTGDDAVSISVRFLVDATDASAQLVNDALTHPRFDQDALERNRAQILSGIASAAQDPGSIAQLTYFNETFPDHPYGTDLSGTSESVAVLSADDLREAHQNVLVRERARVGIVGALTPEQAMTLVDVLLEGLADTGPALPAAPEVGALEPITVIDFPTPQSVAIFGQPGMSQDDPDFFAAFILSTLMGGRGPESILMHEVREERGLTYGVYADLAEFDQASLYLGNVASANGRIAEAISVIQDEWTRMASDGITQDQLDRAKTYLTGEYPLRFDSNAAIARIMVGMQITDKTPDYINTRNDRVNAVTLEDANRTAARLYDPDGLSFVVVGQPEGLD